MTDLFGAEPQRAQFKDIRNTLDSVAEEKAVLALELGSLINKPPKAVINGSVQVTRAWREAREKAAKVAKSSRSSVNDLRSAISSM